MRRLSQTPVVIGPPRGTRFKMRPSCDGQSRGAVAVKAASRDPGTNTRLYGTTVACGFNPLWKGRRPMFKRRTWRSLSRIVVAVLMLLVVGMGFAEEPSLSKSGRAEAMIVVGRDSSEFGRWVAGEIQRYLKQLSGAELPIVTSDQLKAQKPLIVVGGPRSNPLAAAAQDKQLVHFADLRPDGFILKSVHLPKCRHSSLAATTRPARCTPPTSCWSGWGSSFSLPTTSFPSGSPTWPCHRWTCAWSRCSTHRGMHCCHGIRWYMGLADFRQEIDQLAKLKLNVLQFFWGMGGPWAEFSYGGKVAEIIYPKESGYCAWAWNSGTAKSVKVGRECFPQDYLGPPEFARAQTQEEAYRTARDFLREVIRYAHRAQSPGLAGDRRDDLRAAKPGAASGKEPGVWSLLLRNFRSPRRPGHAGHLGGRGAKHDRELSGRGPLLGHYRIGSPYRGR